MLRRLVALPTAAMFARASSYVKSNDPTHEDDRWLEAEFANNAEMTIEERYAAEKQREVMKKMLAKMRTHTQTKVDAAEEKRQKEVAELKAQMAALHAKLEEKLK